MTTGLQEMNAAARTAAPAEKTDTVDAIQQYVAENKPVIGRMVAGEFEITDLTQAEKLSTMLAAHTPCPDKASLGFWELLANAVEHGNLEIDFDTKSELLQSGEIENEIGRRLETSPFRDRVVRVEFRCTRDLIRLRVQDEGPGFDHAKVLAAEMPMDRPNGRGLHVARSMCFDTMCYEGNGNTVEATIKL